MTPWIQFCAACAGLNKRSHTCDVPPPSRRKKERRVQIRVPGVFAPGYDTPSGTLDTPDLNEDHAGTLTMGTPEATSPNEYHAGTIGDNGKLEGGRPGDELDMELEEHFFEQGVEEECEVDVFDHVRQAL